MAIRSTGKDRWQVKVYRGVDEHGKQVWEYRSADGCRGGRICPLDSAWGAALGAAWKRAFFAGDEVRMSLLRRIAWVVWDELCRQEVFAGLGGKQ